jgi:hypothetical protein
MAKTKVTTPTGKAKVHKVMSEFKEGTLKSGSGTQVTSRKQAIAIGLSEADRTQRRGFARTGKGKRK